MAFQHAETDKLPEVLPGAQQRVLNRMESLADAQLQRHHVVALQPRQVAPDVAL